MIEFLVEFMFEGLSEVILRLLTKHMKKKCPDYDNGKLKKVLMEIFTGVIVIAVFIVCCIVFLLLMQLWQKLSR